MLGNQSKRRPLRPTSRHTFLHRNLLGVGQPSHPSDLQLDDEGLIESRHQNTDRGRLFTTLDTNADGRISLAEFSAGWGKFQAGDAKAPSRVIHEMVIRQIMNNLVSACLSVGGNDEHPTELRRISEILTSWLTTEKSAKPKLFSVHFQQDRKLIAVGAPAHLYYPVVSGNLGLNLEIPVHADVANAVGAVVGSVTQREHMSITQPTLGLFRVHDEQGPADFTLLKEAIQFAESATATRARARAHSAGAATIEVTTEHIQTSVEPDDLSEEVFFECRVTSTASGRPSVLEAPGKHPVIAPSQDN